MASYLLRGAFILLTTAVATLYVLPLQEPRELNIAQVVLAIAATLAIAVAMIGLDIAIKQKKLAVVAGVFVGLIAGLVVGWALGIFVDFVGVLIGVNHMNAQDQKSYEIASSGIKVFIGLITCYWGISLVLQTRGDFRFILPYLEFKRQVRGTRAVLVDSSVLIDGRIAEMIQTHILQGGLIVPKFVLEELQLIADSTDKLRRARGRRGLEILQRLRDDANLDVSIHEAEADGTNVDQKLVALALDMQARVMTNDYNLQQVCILRGVEVINLNDVAKALRPVALPGETMRVKIVRPGEATSQGVGYLDDGTMVVVENARKMVDQEIEMSVTSTLQTSAGRMIFGRYVGDGDADDGTR